MLTKTFKENTNAKHVKRTSETLDGNGTSNLSDSNHEVCDGSEISVDSEELIDVKIGGEREDPRISRNVDNDYSKTDTNGTKTKLVPNETTSSSFSLEISSNDFFQARKVNFDESSASESASKDEQIDVSHGSSKSIGSERDNLEISKGDNSGYLIIDTNGIKNILIPDEASSSSSSSEPSSNDFSQARKVNFAKLSVSESASKDDYSDVSHESSKSIGGERKNLEISRSDHDYLKTYTNDTKSILVPDETLSSSSSSKSSSNDFSQTRKANFSEFPASKVSSKDEVSDVSRQSSIKSEPGNDFPIRASTSPIYNLNRGHMSMSPTVAPPAQVMDRSSKYDSYRIPASVFAVTTNPMDWTNDSDESLFSIQIGNHSLAGDHMFTAPELRKSVDLTKSGGLNMLSPQPSALIEDRDTCRKSVETEDSQTTEMSDEDFKLEGSLDKNKNNLKNSHPAISYNSSGNGIGAQSSALPIEKKKEEPLCRCFTCGWSFCCLSWPSCSCLKCSLALCCCWHASPVLPEVENHNSMETDNHQVTSDSTSDCCNLCHCFSWPCCTSCWSHTDSPQQKFYEKDSEETSSSTSHCSCSWFHCFLGSCCSWDICCCCCTSSSTSHCCSWFRCFSGSCCSTYEKDSEKTSSSTFRCCSCFHCFSGSCCSTYGKDSEKTSNSTSRCCRWFHCFSGSCCSAYEKGSEKTCSSASHCCSCFHCFSGSCCSWDICCCCCCCCSETDCSRHQSLDKAFEETSSSTSNCFQCCSWSCCSLEENNC